MPWITHIPPVSFLAFNDVREGRETLNFSEWQAGSAGQEDDNDEIKELGEVVLEGEMLMHPEARLTQEENAALARGLAATSGINR